MQLRLQLGPRSLAHGVLEKGSLTPLGGIGEQMMGKRREFKGNALGEILFVLPPEEDVFDNWSLRDLLVGRIPCLIPMLCQVVLNGLTLSLPRGMRIA